MSILFTTGATVTFHKLIDYVVRPDFLDFLCKKGFSRILLQYGNEVDSKGTNLSKRYLSDALARENTLETLDLAIQNETNDKSCTTFSNSFLTLEVFAYSNELPTLISSADIVVSHAGTGSILDTLRLHVPLVVVTNDDLMDSHQAEVAAEFEKGGFLALLSAKDLAHGLLEEKIGALQGGKLRLNVLPEACSNVLSSIIADEIGESIGKR